MLHSGLIIGSIFLLVARAVMGALPSPVQGGLLLARSLIFLVVVALISKIIAAAVVGESDLRGLPGFCAPHPMLVEGCVRARASVWWGEESGFGSWASCGSGGWVHAVGVVLMDNGIPWGGIGFGDQLSHGR